GILGILKAGGAYVPLDPSYPQARLEYLLEDTDIKHLLTQSDLKVALELAENINVIELDTLAFRKKVQTYPSSNLELTDNQNSSNLAYVIHTSGSTGKPKGVMIEHRSLLNRIDWMQKTYQLKVTDRVLQKTPYCFDVSVWEFVWTLGYGARLVIAKPNGHKDREYLKDLILQQQISVIHFVPPMLRAYLDTPLIEFPESLRYVFCSGEALEVADIKTMQERAHHVKLHNLYGPTEAAIDVSNFNCGALNEQQTVPIGKPIQNIKLLVLNNNFGCCPMGAAGELFIGGAGLARGYLNQPELTKEKFIQNPFSDDPQERLYKTGDLVRYLPDGNLEFMGRMDDQVKLRGYRIELGEIESALSKREAVVSCLVLAREDEPGQKRLVAYVVTKVDEVLDEIVFVNALRDGLQQTLPDYMVPSNFVILEAFPLTANGKVDKKALPAPDGTLLQGEYVAPESETEKTLAKIWAKLLKLDEASISVTANFFELGGDSILSIQVVSRAAQQGLYFSVKDLFNAQTIRLLAKVSKSGSQVLSPQGEVTGALRLLPIQRQFFKDEIDLHHFNQAVMLTTPKDFSAEALTVIIKTLVTQHDSLRLCFKREAGDWQASHPPLTESLLAKLLEVKSWSDASYSGIEDYANQIQQSLKPEDGVLLKAAYIKPEPQGDETGRLLLVIHHLVVDGVSWRIILEDIERLYGQWLSGSTLTLPAKTSSYQQWGHFLSDYSQSELLHQEQSYWLDSFSLPVKRLADLPVNHSITPRETGIGQAHLRLTAAQTEQLLSQCNATYRTQVNELLLAGLLLGFHQWSDERALRIDLEGHGRETLTDEIDLSRTVGWFTSVYPLTLSLTHGDSLADIICAVKEQYRAIPHRGIGFGVLSELRGVDEFKELPASELVFNYLGQFDQVVNAETYLKVAKESSGQSMSMARKAVHPLSINGMVSGGCLSFGLSFDKSQYAPAAMQSLMDAFASGLEALIAHCVSTPWGRYSPSDFPLAQTSSQELAQWQVETDENVEDLYPATGMQQGLLFHSLLEQGRYVTQTLLTFKDLNVDCFQQAWQQVVERHVIFRTAFVGLEVGNAHQLVYREVELPWRFEDLSKLDGKAQQDKIEVIRLADKRKGFEPSQAPLMRMTVLKLGPGKHQVIWSHHHALLDGWCLPLVFGEMVACYQALSQGETIKLTPVNSYRDYAVWLAAQSQDDAKAFWAEQLSALEGMTPLPLAVNRPEEKETELLGVYQQTLSLTDTQTQQLQALARSTQTTVNVIVQAAWGLLLSRYSGEAQVVFGATTSGRPPELSGVEQMVGLFINTLPVVVDVHVKQTVKDWLQQLHRQLVEREAYNYLPLNEIQQLAPVSQGLFNSLMVFENYPVDDAIGESASKAKLKVAGIQTFEGTNYGLSLTTHLGQTLSIKLEAQKKGFTETALSQFTPHLKQLLLSLAASTSPETMRVNDVEMLSKEETHYLVHELNDTQVDYPQDKLIHELFEMQVEQNPDNIAVVFEDKELTYQELNEASNRLAHYLREQGVEAETLVGICVERSLEMVVGILGILKAGGAYVPLDPSYPQARLEYMLQDTGLTHLVTHSGLTDAIELSETVKVFALDSEKHQQALQAFPLHNLERTAQQESSNLAYVIYTSGSTG
ncbi:MAG: amino acid adenylation domain-containing protein, partial [Cycloclasticus sp.]|nr:amino acid adenylation domain-containing protein [Cycloclasticus sp.]